MKKHISTFFALIINKKQEDGSMTLHIAVCDDAERVGFQVEGLIEKICGKMKIKTEIDVYFSCEGLYAKLEEGKCYDLIFLDIEFKEINGIEIGAKIRSKLNDEFTQIVYISGKSEYALELFDINPLNFLVKPLDYEKLEKVIKKYLKLEGFWEDTFYYKIGHDSFKIKLKDLKYLEGNGKRIILHLKDKKEEIYNSLSNVYSSQLVKYDFLYIHKSYIVNYDYISVCEYTKIVLSDGMELPIGQGRRKEIRRNQIEMRKKRVEL
jgi:DNA-binding LytR/AlgR family response regulator